jgi:site-specific recombinase XerD
MRYSAKLLLRHNKAKDNGLTPIYLRIIIDQKVAEISTGYYIPIKAWDEKQQAVRVGYSQAEVINVDITGKKTLAMQRIVEAGMKGTPLTASQAKDLIQNRRDLHNIFEFIVEHTEAVKHKREGSTIETYERFERKLEIVHGSRNLAFEDIDVNWLYRFEKSLRDEGLDGNYVHLNLTMLRRFFNAAKKRGIVNHYPFANYEMPEYEQKEKDYLSLEEVIRLEEYADQVTDPTLKQTAIYFLLGCYTGLRISDWFRFDLKKNIHAGDVRLRAKKNGEWVLMPMSSPFKRNLKRMAAIPLTISEPEINRSLKDIAPKIKAEKYLTTHSGRHTFAVTFCADQGIGLEVCAELMGITVDTCQRAYYRVTKGKIARECNEKWTELK